MRLGRFLAAIACVLFLTGSGWSQETPPNLPPDGLGVAVIVHPENPTPFTFVSLEIHGRTNNLGDWVQLKSVTMADHLIVVQLGLHWSPRASLTDAPLAAAWKYQVDLGNLPEGRYRVLVFLNGVPGVEKHFGVGQNSCDRPLLVYNETGGFIGLNNHLLVMPVGDYHVHWLVLDVSNSAGGVVNGIPGTQDCGGRLTDEQLGRLEEIFASHHFDEWDPVYGIIPGTTDPAIGMPIVADGRVWRIEWKGKVVHVFEGGEIPDRVMDLIMQLDGFAMDLARHCPQPPPPQLGGQIKSITPEHPSASDTLFIKVGGVFPDPSFHVTGKEVVLIGREVHVRVKVERDPNGPATTVLQPWEETLHAGPLDSGPWIVILEVNGHAVDRRDLWISGGGPNTNEVVVLVFPDIPTASTPIALEILGFFHEPRHVVEHSWAQENHTIHVTIKSATADANTLPPIGADGTVMPWRVREELGLLASGEYHVVVHLDGHGVAERNFVVHAASTNIGGQPGIDLDNGTGVDVDSSGRVDFGDLMRLMRYWHID